MTMSNMDTGYICYYQRNIPLGKAPDLSAGRDKWIAQQLAEHPIHYDTVKERWRPHHMVFIDERTGNAVLKWWEPVIAHTPK